MYLLFYSPSPHPLQYQWPMEGVGPETHIHKITNVPVFYMALGLNDLDAGNILYEGHWKGWVLKSSLYGP